MRHLVMILAIAALIVLNTVQGWGEVFQLHLGNQDTDEAHRKQAGDIVSVHNADHVCGRMTKRHYLIVWVDFDRNMIEKNEAKGLTMPLREDCSFDAESEPTAQCRFKIDLSELDALSQSRGVSIDWKRLRDPDDEYQPFYPDGDIVFDYSDLVFDKCSAHKLSATDLTDLADIATSGVTSTKGK